MDRYNRLLSQLIEPKGLKMINAFDMTAGTVCLSVILYTIFFTPRKPQHSMASNTCLTVAFTYDSATQMDGMHMIGPPMKMLVTKLFHHLCSGIVPGSTV
jgi:hypothetical protein